MKSRDPFKLAVAGIALLMAATPALAVEGLYAGLQGGVSLPTKTNVEVSANGTTASGDVKIKDGPIGGLVVGYGFANGLQPELELSYLRNKPKDGGGDLRAAAAVGSLYYNFSQHGYYFYLGGGAGVANLRYHADGGGSDNTYQPLYQAGTGVGLAVSRNLLVGVDYRYRGTFDRAKFSFDNQGTPTDARFNVSGSLVTIGLRWSFGGFASSSVAPGYREPVSIVPVQ